MQRHTLLDVMQNKYLHIFEDSFGANRFTQRLLHPKFTTKKQLLVLSIKYNFPKFKQKLLKNPNFPPESNINRHTDSIP